MDAPVIQQERVIKVDEARLNRIEIKLDKLIEVSVKLQQHDEMLATMMKDNCKLSERLRDLETEQMLSKGRASVGGFLVRNAGSLISLGTFVLVVLELYFWLPYAK